MKKAILTIVIAAVTGVLIFAAEQDAKTQAPATEHHVLNPADLKWMDNPPGLPPAGKMAVLNGDPTQAGPFTVRLKAPAGYKIMPHTHPTAERLTLISGKVRIGMGDRFDKAALQEIEPGGYVVLPAGMAHFAKLGADSILQVDSEGPFQINYVNPSDDPRNAKQ
jgi:hypothetical protein